MNPDDFLKSQTTVPSDENSLGNIDNIEHDILRYGVYTNSL